MASSSEAGLEPYSSLSDKDVTRPRRPPRRISRMFDTSPVSSSNGDISAPELNGTVQVFPRATGSQLDRIKSQSRSTDEDVDRTPTKHNHYTAAGRERATLDNHNGHPSTQRISRSRQSEERSLAPRLSVPNLRHQSSAATIKSSDRADGADMRSKSSVYEQEIQQMRAESRLGDRDEESNDWSFSRSSVQHGADATDTSGTEGSGPIIENRRRKKSSTSSSSKRAAARALNARDERDELIKRSSPQKERLASLSMRSNYSGRDPYGTLTSPLRTESALEFTQFPPTRRTPLASAFQTSRYRSDDLVDARSETGRANQRIDNGEQATAWPRGEELPPVDRREDRRRRHVSEAFSQASDASGRQGRMVVDTSVVSKHLAQPSRYGSVAENRADWSDRSSNRSVSEVIRPRKVSATSSLSQRSSGGASDLHRTASRASLRRSGKDVFDDGGMAPPLPTQGGHPLSPRHLAPDQFQQQTMAMAQALKQKQDRLRETKTTRGEDWRKEVEELQSRIDQLTMAAAATSPQVETYSRSSSRMSATAPRSGHSNISSTPSASLARRPKDRPSTEPRLPRASTGRVSSDLSSSLRYESSSRLGLRESERRLPVTPNMMDGRGGSLSRMSGVHTGPLPSTGRFSSLGQSDSRSLSASSSAGPLHERNLLNSYEIFERYMLESTRIPSESSQSPRSSTEAVDLVHRFKETSDTAININAGLRLVLQTVLELQIDAEVGETEVDKAAIFAEIDRSLSAILRDSDEQIRSLTDGLITFTRAEKERDRLRKKHYDQSNQTTLPRSTSRLSSLALTQISPGKERLLRNESRQGQAREAERRTSSLDLRRSLSIRDRLAASNSNTSMQAVESRSDQSNGSRKSSDSGKQSRASRRFSLLHELSPGTSTTSTQFPPSPYSPSPNPTSGVAAGISPTLDMHSAADKHRSRLNHSMTHARSFSELSPKIRSDVDGEILQHRSPLLRQDKSSTNSAQTVRAPPSLSPRRSRPSFPRVSATTVNASSIMSGNATSEEGHSSEGRNGFSIAGTSPDDYRDETRSIFQSLGRSRGPQMSRNM